MIPYERDKQTGWQAVEYVRPLFIAHADGGFVTDLEGGPLASVLNRAWGDVILRHHGRLATVDIKNSADTSTDIPVEIWSNLALTNRRQWLTHTITEGCAIATRATLLAFVKVKRDRLLLLDTFSLLRWAFWTEGYNAVPNIERSTIDASGDVTPEFPYAAPHNGGPNVTRMRWVPLRVLIRELEVTPVVCSVQQLHFAFDQGASPLNAVLWPRGLVP